MKIIGKLTTALVSALLAFSPIYSGFEPGYTFYAQEISFNTEAYASSWSEIETAIQNQSSVIYLTSSLYQANSTLPVTSDLTLINITEGPVTFVNDGSAPFFILNQASLSLIAYSEAYALNLTCSRPVQASSLIEGQGSVSLDYVNIKTTFSTNDQESFFINLTQNISLNHGNLQGFKAAGLLCGLEASRIEISNTDLETASSANQAQAIRASSFLNLENSYISGYFSNPDSGTIDANGVSTIFNTTIVNQAPRDSIALYSNGVLNISSGTNIKAGTTGVILNGYGTSTIGSKENAPSSIQIYGNEIGLLSRSGVLEINSGLFSNTQNSPTSSTAAALATADQARILINGGIFNGADQALSTYNPQSIRIQSSTALFSQSSRSSFPADEGFEMEIPGLLLDSVFPDSPESRSFYCYFNLEQAPDLINDACNLVGVRSFNDDPIIISSLNNALNNADVQVRLSSGYEAENEGYWNLVIRTPGTFALPDYQSPAYFDRQIFDNSNGKYLSGWRESEYAQSDLINRINVFEGDSGLITLYGLWSEDEMIEIDGVDLPVGFMSFLSNDYTLENNPVYFEPFSGNNHGLVYNGPGFTQSGSQNFPLSQLQESLGINLSDEIFEPQLMDYEVVFAQDIQGIKTMTIFDKALSRIVLVNITVPNSMEEKTISRIDLGTNSNQEHLVINGSLGPQDATLIRFELPYEGAYFSAAFELLEQTAFYSTTGMILDENLEGKPDAASVIYPEQNLLVIPSIENKLYQIANNPKEFSDLNEDYMSEVQYVASRDIMNGREIDGEHVFAAEEPVQRAEFARMLSSFAGDPELEVDLIPEEVKDSWYANPAAYVISMGLMGVNSPFEGENYITREQICQVFYRLAGQPETDLTLLDRFADTFRVSEDARPAVAWAVSMDIIGGLSYLMPDFNASRAQIAKMFMKDLQSSFQSYLN